ncbi:UDP-4-amino-4,6-dideoxy-N-acetyl-beta-L-altrosamine transaminase [Paenibacillus sp. 1_12]|uniref:UDP-4-amino-4, 6-dideoxy-N-acetyl-beta-L-altrosamine transaminase n=1 Tax=Paenibacillus sp. 1_12 TaxID=1566278 RepID=UPI0008E2B955|nr:UDP-4-amino-4,6-dideoxy-N-acetyl-beta-L-altrosamine transaminase [Paenibacillus sp. 1_12]SFL89693.1 UDP-4-amino-4,6-dideoxy-N-acetyl-beta-L-altrosamine transaminase [Paenibacillus sp. 1_12]
MEKPAIAGGTPVREQMLSYGKQFIDEQDIAAVIDTLRGDFITQGPAINRFEQAIAEYVGAKFAVAFSNGTAALHGACFAAGIGLGDEVITTPITFLASSNCVLYQGGTPVFADIRSDTYNLDPIRVAEKITNRTKAIIAVDYTGQPCDIDTLMKLAEKHNLIVIQDAAHSLGAEVKGRKVGAIADMTMFSFHPVKHITTGEGGMITTNNEEFYHKLLMFRSHGMTKDPDLLHHNDGPWYYEMQLLGYNYRITDIQASLGTSQLTKLEGFLDRRRQIAAAYSKAFNGLEGVTVPYQQADHVSSWHLYILRFDLTRFQANRKQIFEALRAENIGVHVHYIPVYKQLYYQQNGYAGTVCLESEKLYEEMITIPLFPTMTEQDVLDVIESVKKIYQYYQL